MNIDRITKYASVLAIAILIAGLCACDLLDPLLIDDGTVSHEAMQPQFEGLNEEILIGVVVSKTGPFADTFGIPMIHGFELAREEINEAQIGDARIKFLIEDDQGTVEGAVNTFDKLILEGKASAILGPTLSSQAEVVFETAQKNRIVALASISAASGLSAIGDYNFRINLPNNVLHPGS